MSQTRFSVAAAALAVGLAMAESILYVTDMPAYNVLAPCAQSALAYNIQYLTGDACPEAVSELQSCVCTKNNNFRSVSSGISQSISYGCGSTASDDHSSAQSVLTAYCDPSKTVKFATPTAVSVFITDIPEFDYLAPCAKSALGYAVETMTYELCQSDAPALASCACNKNQNSLVVSQIINSSVKYSCSGHLADVTSAQEMFSAYCAMNDGTTKFPTPSDPPGDMTYYITDLPGFSSLAPCAATGLGYAIQSQLYELCPDGPQALASCVCLKESMTNEVLKAITSSVKYECESTATEDVASAISLYDYYCSAAAAEVTPPGVHNSVGQSHPASRTSGGPKQTGTGGAHNGNGSGSGDGNGSSDGFSNGNDKQSSGPSTGVIVGAVVAVILGLAIIGAIIFFVIRARRNRPGSVRIPENDPSVPLGPYGKAELASDSIAAPVHPSSPSPSTLKPGAIPTRADNISPVSATTGAFTPPPNQAELSGQAAFYPPMPNRPELHNQATGSPSLVSPGSDVHGQPGQPPQHAAFAAPPNPNAPELYGQGAPASHRPELQGQGAMYANTPANMSELQGQGTQYHNANPNRPELAGQYNYPPQQSPYTQQQQQSPPPQYQQAYSPQHSPYNSQSPYDPPVSPPQQQMHGGHPQQQQQQQSTYPQSSWQAGPVPDLHDL
ncbi:uncharacterized protein C8A04DRAFT_27038 [Dichotomopilus funicola]|uniref:Uncharacterized protein n=1 Tax=Dichotomopilus funicola TaxID=1934379 RepID=A0AAN6V5H9_9PEZI|nr:hypothetical protein C8A04DRAFT_27038 [Dichotomopilus funicola]